MSIIRIKRTIFDVEIVRQGLKDIAELHRQGFRITRGKPYRVVKV